MESDTTLDNLWIHANVITEHNALDTCMTMHVIVQMIKSSSDGLTPNNSSRIDSILANWNGLDNLLSHFRPYVIKNEVLDLITAEDLDNVSKMIKLCDLLYDAELEFDIRVHKVARTAGQVSETMGKSVYDGKDSGIMKNCFADCLHCFKMMTRSIRREFISAQKKTNFMSICNNRINAIIWKSVQSMDQRIVVGTPPVYCILVHGFRNWHSTKIKLRM